VTVDGVEASDRGTVVCTDCDARGDRDEVGEPNRACSFRLRVCLNRDDGSGACTPEAVRKVRVKVGGKRVRALEPVPAGAGPACGQVVEQAVRTTRRGTRRKARVVVTAAVGRQRGDKDVVTLVCAPQEGQCPPRCGDGRVEAGERCDPPGTGACAAGETCGDACVCEPLCGNGRIDAGETCDPPETGVCPANQRCDERCACEPHCGNGRLDPGEACDGTACPDGGACRSCECPPGCPLPTCEPHRIVTDSTGHCVVQPSTVCTEDADCAEGQCAGDPPREPCTGDADCEPGVRCIRCETDGKLTVSTLPEFPFPLGVVTILDVGPGRASAERPTACFHDVIVPAGGFAVPTFCIPDLGFSSGVQVTGCALGGASGSGRLWDGFATFPDADVRKRGDTSDGVCNPGGQPCTVGPGGAGANDLGDVDTVRGDGTPDGSGVHLHLDIPARSITWNDADASCPDADGVYDPDTDTLVSLFDFILSPTTATASAEFADENGDRCAKAGNGPTGPVTLGGAAASGPCCVVGQDSVLAAVGIAFSGGAPLYDLIFKSKTPTRVRACEPAVPLGECTLATTACVD
jgi:hypothetical protein